MTPQIVLETMQWAQLSDIGDVEPVGDRDRACLEELRAVLAKHGAGNRFGLHLIHKHFDVADDEVLVEYTDADTRTLSCRVEKRRDVQGSNVIETQWRVGMSGASMACVGYCNWDRGHRRIHQQK